LSYFAKAGAIPAFIINTAERQQNPLTEERKINLKAKRPK